MTILALPHVGGNRFYGRLVQFLVNEGVEKSARLSMSEDHVNENPRNGFFHSRQQTIF